MSKFKVQACLLISTQSNLEGLFTNYSNLFRRLKFAKLGQGIPTWQTGLFQATLGEVSLVTKDYCILILPQELPGLQHPRCCFPVPSRGLLIYLFFTQESKLYPHRVSKLCSQVQLLLPKGTGASLRARMAAPFFTASLLRVCAVAGDETILCPRHKSPLTNVA